MALDAQQVHIAHFQHMRVRPAVRNMARLASFDLDGRVFEHIRPFLFRVALEADRILRGGSPHLLRFHCTVYVMAITALDQPFVDAMMKGHFELGPLLEVARVTELRLFLLQQEFFGLRMMRRMARGATDVVLAMHGVDCVHVLRTARVAGEATVIDLPGRVIFKDEDLSGVPTARHVR